MATDTKISGQMSSRGIAREDRNPPTTAVGRRQAKSPNRCQILIVLAYA